MIPSQQSDLLRVSRLQQQKHCHRLDTIVAPVYKIAHEDVACVRALPSCTEQLEKVVELPVDVPTYGDRARDRLYGALLEHQLLHILAQVLQIPLRKQLALAHALNPLVQVPHLLST
eukprot:CAMPEP_0182818406 /NCGR_PEP_ID=MMETSP0006_2-20121128/12000_1 /TAXON_ID=97485 /ORGANISM="Prymnesium parvum, Strain Texoma1" /LENGTH=116 /DNA_ID=CAMNT_0024944855 /DNA_START=893 /DNA_END=1243 /DNA_ORIENTATION=-